MNLRSKRVTELDFGEKERGQRQKKRNAVCRRGL